MKKALSLALALVMALGMTACGQKTPSTSGSAGASEPGGSSDASGGTSAQTYTIKLGYSPSGVTKEESPTVMWGAAFKEKLEELTDGGIVVEIYDGGQLGSDTDTTGAVSAGSVEMSVQATSVLANYEPKIMAFDLAGVFGSATDVLNMFNGQWVRENIFDSLQESADIRVLSGYCRGFRCFTSSTKELKTVDDIAGQTIRIMDNAMYKAIVEALSASPVSISGGEMYTAMANKVVDGHENTVFSYYQDKTYEVQDYAVMDEHTASVECGFMNATFYNSLPADYQKAIDEAAAYAAAQSENVRAEQTEVVTQKLIDLGMKIYVPTAEEYQAWHDAYRQASIDFLAERVGQDFLDGFMSAYDALSK